MGFGSGGVKGWAGSGAGRNRQDDDAFAHRGEKKGICYTRGSRAGYRVKGWAGGVEGWAGGVEAWVGGVEAWAGGPRAGWDAAKALSS